MNRLVTLEKKLETIDMIWFRTIYHDDAYREVYYDIRSVFIPDMSRGLKSIIVRTMKNGL